MDVVAFMVYIFRHAVIVLYAPFSLRVSSAIHFNFYRIACASCGSSTTQCLMICCVGLWRG